MPPQRRDTPIRDKYSIARCACCRATACVIALRHARRDAALPDATAAIFADAFT